MATSRLLLPVGAVTLPDGSGSNAAPALVRFQGTETSPHKHLLALAFDASTSENAWFIFRMPGDYVSGGTVIVQWMANATANAVVWGARLGAITPGDADTPIEHAQAAATTTTTNVNTTEGRRLTETSITLANLDSAAAGDLIALLVYRDATNGADTCTVDGEVVSVTFEYTS